MRYKADGCSFCRKTGKFLINISFKTWTIKPLSSLSKAVMKELSSNHCLTYNKMHKVCTIKMSLNYKAGCLTKEKV